MSIPSLNTTPSQDKNPNKQLGGFYSTERVEDRKQPPIKMVDELVPNATANTRTKEEAEEYGRKINFHVNEGVILPGGGVRLSGYSTSDIDEHDESLPEIVDWNSFAVRANQYLAVGALLPVVGTITGTAKIALSIIFIVGAAVSYAISSCTRVYYKSKSKSKVWYDSTYENKELSEKLSRRINYGFSNMVVGLLEAIPIVGSIVAIFQVVNCWSCKMGPELAKLNG